LRELLLLAIFSTPAVADRCHLTPREIDDDLRQLERALREDWAYLEAKKLDLAAVFREARNAADFPTTLRQIVAATDDGHADVISPCDPPYVGVWPIRVVDTREGVAVSEVSDASLPIKVGDRVVSVNGQPIEELVAARACLIAAATDAVRRYRALWRLPTMGHAQIALVHPDGKKLEVAIPARPAPSPGPWIDTRKLPGNLGYLRIRTFLPFDQKVWLDPGLVDRDAMAAAPAAQIDEAFRALDGTRALIIDLRGNAGGTDILSMRVARHLVPDGHTFYSLSGKQAGGWAPPSPVENWGKFPIYRGRLAVLIDEGTCSAADNLVAALHDLRPETYFVGQPTSGSSGAPRTITLRHSGASVTFCTIRVYGPGGDLIEGRGTVPSARVLPSRLDLVDKRDAVLEKALETLLKL
jgi:C-terminal processing protease CtpA/Prc